MTHMLTIFLSATKTLDMTATQNIAFVAALSALCVLLAAAVIVVLARGKRKAGAFDIVLRIFASVALFASVLGLAATVLCGLSGDVRIDPLIHSLIIKDTMRPLPMPALYGALQTVVGAALVSAAFVLSVVALVCDCLIANKKDNEKKPAKARKTPEELKREAEIARIRRLADSAVQKSATAANTPAKSKPRSADAPKDVPADEKPSAELDDEPEFDWRVEQPKKQSASFVGIKDKPSDEQDFDSFDSFDDADGDDAKDDYDFKVIENDLQGEDETDGQAEEQFAYDEEGEQDEAPYYEEEQTGYRDGARADAFDGAKRTATENEPPLGEQEAQLADDVEPDRNIYIPEIRTIRREPKQAAAKKPVAAKPAAKPAVKKPAAKKPAVKKAAADKPTKPAADKPVAAAKTVKPKKSASTAEARPDKKRKAPPDDGKTMTIPKVDPKKLPVTRRYVIIDRTSAVNIFSEYLKAKDEQAKDKLESSINTIILK